VTRNANISTWFVCLVIATVTHVTHDFLSALRHLFESVLLPICHHQHLTFDIFPSFLYNDLTILKKLINQLINSKTAAGPRLSELSSTHTSRDRLSIFGFQLFLVTLTTVTRADVVASADIGSVAGVRRVSGGSPLD
jgi:hypothetical protein